MFWGYYGNTDNSWAHVPLEKNPAQSFAPSYAVAVEMPGGGGGEGRGQDNDLLRVSMYFERLLSWVL